MKPEILDLAVLDDTHMQTMHFGSSKRRPISPQILGTQVPGIGVDVMLPRVLAAGLKLPDAH